MGVEPVLAGLHGRDVSAQGDLSKIVQRFSPIHFLAQVAS
jgi:hypothetical protein